MFTGIIEETGRLRSLDISGVTGRIELEASKVLEGTNIGDSIAVNGVCLTVVELHADGFTADVMPETISRTGFSQLRVGDEVNLERAMPANGRFGGHIVSGHIDGVGTVESLEHDGIAVWVSINAPTEILKLIVEKGSIAIDGISLTVAYVDNERFKVSIIPHTGEETTLLKRHAGDKVNLENDIVGKYVEKLLGLGEPTVYGGTRQKDDNESGLTLEFLAENGF